MGHIYKITNPEGRIYVGKTTKLERRIADYKWRTPKRSNQIICNSILKHGWKKHIFEIIEEVDDSLLDEREVFWISELKTYKHHYENGMNLTLGGDGQKCTWMHDVERREKQGKRFSGEGNPFYGKTHNEEIRKIISEKAIIRQKESGWTIPEWGAEKGRNVVRRPVVAYNNKGKKKGEYISLSECAKKLKINHASVSESIKYGTWVFGKYKIYYNNGDMPEVIDVPSVIHVQQEKKPVVCVDKNGKKIMFESRKEASESLGVSVTTITKLAELNDGTPMKQLSKRYRFFWKDNY